MPSPYLPEDFWEKRRSLWVDGDSRPYDPVKGHELNNDYLDLRKLAPGPGYARNGEHKTFRRVNARQQPIQKPMWDGYEDCWSSRPLAASLQATPRAIRERAQA